MTVGECFTAVPVASSCRCPRESGILSGVESARSAGREVFVAADVHYFASGGARAAAVVAADAAFSHLVADRVELLADVRPYRPGEFYLRELTPLRAVLGRLHGMALLVLDGYADLDPAGPAWAPMRTPSSASR